MKTLSIQIQPDRIGLYNLDNVVKELSEKAINQGASVSISEGVDSVRYVNINLKSQNVSELWNVLKPEFVSNNKLSYSAIVCCEGKSGWDDYLLLFHFDSSLVLDPV